MAIPFVADLEQVFADSPTAVTIHPRAFGDIDHDTGERDATGDDISTTCISEGVGTQDVLAAHGLLEMGDTKVLVFAAGQSDTYTGVGVPNTEWTFTVNGQEYQMIHYSQTPDGIAYWLFGRRMNR